MNFYAADIRRRPTISASGRDSGRDGVVPFGMERIALDIAVAVDTVLPVKRWMRILATQSGG